MSFMSWLGPLFLQAAAGADQSAMNRKDREFWETQTGEAEDAINKWGTDMFSGTEDFSGMSTLIPAFSQANKDLAAGVRRDGSGLVAGQQADYANLLNDFYGMSDSVQSRYDTMASDIKGQYGGFEGDLNKRYADRTKTGMGMLEGYGDQQKADISQKFANLGGAQTAQLAASGLGGTSVGASMATGRAREESAEQRRLGEDVTRMKSDVYSDLSGDELGARYDLGQGRMGMLYDLGKGGVDLSKDLGVARAELGDTALSRMRDVSEEYLDRTYAADVDALNADQSLNLLPMQQAERNLDRLVGAKLDFGLPPEYISPWAYPAQAATTLSAARMSKPPKQDRGGSFSILGSGMSW
jgi:hypothetical protein